MLPWHQYLLGILFILAGVWQFRKPTLKFEIVPKYFLAKNTVIPLSGIAAMILGFMLLNPPTQQIASWGIIGSLFIFLAMHFYFWNQKKEMKNDLWILILWIIMTIALIYWASFYIPFK